MPKPAASKVVPLSRAPDDQAQDAPTRDSRARAEIRTSAIIARLHAFIEGEAEMTAPQVSAALGLLRKSLPDLSSVDMGALIEREAGNRFETFLEAIARDGRRLASEG